MTFREYLAQGERQRDGAGRAGQQRRAFRLPGARSAAETRIHATAVFPSHVLHRTAGRAGGLALGSDADGTGECYGRIEMLDLYLEMDERPEGHDRAVSFTAPTFFDAADHRPHEQATVADAARQ